MTKTHPKIRTGSGRKVIIKKVMIFIGIILVALLAVEGLLLWRLQQQRKTYSIYWINRASEPVSDNAQWYVALGDSTGVGVGASRPENGYVGLIASQLQSATKRPVHVINLATSGARVEDIAEKQISMLKNYTLPKDTIVTLAVGANNIRTLDAESFRQDFDLLLGSLPEQTLVADIPYFGGGRASGGEKNARKANRIIEELTKKHKLKLVRLHQNTKEQNSWFNYAADFFHPNDRAYRIWAQAFWDTIEPQL